MGEIVGLNGKTVDPLAIVIRNAITADGAVSQDLESLTIPVEDWRRTARRVGRELRRPVQTVISPDAVHAVLRDWPANESERRTREQAMRTAAEAITLTDEVLEPIALCPACGSAREWRPGSRLEQAGAVSCPRCGLMEVGNR